MLSRMIFAIGLIATQCVAAGALAQALLIPSEPSVGPLGLSWHRVEVDIDDGTARTKVDQAFRNHTDRVLEATYMFPVPAGASVDDFALYIDGKRVKGSVLEATKARAIYEDIVRRAQDPGLIEWMGKDLFQARIFPIPARGEQRVEIRFVQVLPMDSGLFRYEYPLKASSRLPASTEQDFTLTARLRSKAPIRTLYSPSHEVYVRQKSKNEATVGFEQSKARLDRDFVLYYTVGQEEMGMRLLTHRVGDEPGYFLLMVSPPSTFEAVKTPRKTVTFVLDTSGSMSGDKMDRLRSATLYGLKRLGPEDHFAVIRFSSDVERHRPGFVRATGDNVKDAEEFVRSMEAAGGTAIQEALADALEARAPSVHYVVFVTDGRPTVGETNPDAIVKSLKLGGEEPVRVFAFGVGDDLNAVLLDRLADLSRGRTAYLGDGEQFESGLKSFFDKLSHPALADVKLSVSNAEVYGVLPKALPDLFYGEQLIVLGRYRKPADALVRVGGRLNEQSVFYDYESTMAKEESRNDFVASLWAERQVGYLLDQVRQSGESGELKAEIVQLATRFGIVTPYTSYLVVEPGMDISRPNLVPSTTPPPPRPAPRPQWRAAEPGGSLGGMHGSGTGGGGAMPKAASAPRSEAWPTEDASAAPLASMDELREAEGRKGIDAARKVGRMKGAEQAQSGQGNVIYSGGRTFEWKANRWVDQANKGGLKVLEVKYMSEAWFALVNEVPSLREPLSLGSDVTVVHRGVSIVVGSAGRSQLTPTEVNALR